MENNLENKSKFFALYWGQKVVKYNDIFEDATHVDFVDFIDIKDKAFLELKPLSSISDEDACHIAMLLVEWQDSMSKLKPENIKVRGRIDGDHAWDELIMEFGGAFSYTVRYRGGDFMTWIEPKGRSEWNTYNHLQVYDFLRSRGYALPYMGLSVEELVNIGWVKLKGETK